MLTNMVGNHYGVIMEIKRNFESKFFFEDPDEKLLTFENLLHSFTAKVDGLKQCSYLERLKLLDMSSIERRIERYRTLYSYKILI